MTQAEKLRAWGEMDLEDCPETCTALEEYTDLEPYGEGQVHRVSLTCSALSVNDCPRVQELVEEKAFEGK